jgi:cellobiose phosphorylase
VRESHGDASFTNRDTPSEYHYNRLFSSLTTTANKIPAHLIINNNYGGHVSVKKEFGYFDLKNKEYVITSPTTPTPWINYIGQRSYAGFISATAGGFSWYKDPRWARVLRYRYNSIPADRPGRYLYIRDEETGEYFSPGWQPVQKIDNFECRHGLGYTKIKGVYRELAAETTYFVPVDDDCEIWLTTLKNESSKAKRFKVFTYAEFCFFHSEADQQDVDWVQQCGKGWIDDGVINFTTHFRLWGTSFFSTSLKYDSFDISLDEFIGKYRSESNPIAVERGFGSNSVVSRGNGVGSFCHSINLKAGEEITFAHILGFREKDDVGTIPECVKRWQSIQNCIEAKETLHKFWNEYTGKIAVNTPDKDIDNFVNVWNQYQCKTTFNWSRFVSMYQLGIGRGIGFRDGCQDCLGIMHTDPRGAMVLIRKLLQNQFKAGNAFHQFYPLTGKGDHGEAKDGEGYSDDHLWLIVSISQYLKETGDWGILDEVVSYADDEAGDTIYQHLKQALAFTHGDYGVKGLPRIRFADWNDTINIGRGKDNDSSSVWTAFLFAYVLREFKNIVKRKENGAESVKYQNWYEEIVAQIKKVAWDDDHFIRAFNKKGEPIGSNSNDKGKIFLNAQTWAILSGTVDAEFGKKLMDFTDSMLNTDFGLMLCTPPYDQYNDEIGGATSYPPGAKENGGIFCHTNPWAMIAETCLGRGDKAYKYYCQIHPAKMSDRNRYEVEPYVYAQNILGRSHPKHGLGRNSWLSGTAAWNLIAVTQYILGIRPDYDGLIVDPCIPCNWTEFTVTRIFRGKELSITVSNPGKVQKGLKKVVLNGNVMESNMLPFELLKDKNTVTMIMG